jgi:UDP-3-O-[3-hydroxymyristoyl] glucosamine N-acyltransferase
MAGVGIAGSVVIEDDVILAGHVGVADHAFIGKGARVGAKAGVFSEVKAGSVVSGTPARNHRDVMRAVAAMHRVSKIVDQLEGLIERPADGAKS